MESFDDIKNIWNEGRGDDCNSASLNMKEMDKYIAGGMKKVNSVLIKYFWGTFVYHIIIYALLGHVFVRFWGDTQLMLLSMAGILLYIPFTTIMMKKFKAMGRQDSDAGQSILLFLKHQYKLLAEFFRFKKWFDWIGIPATAFIFVMIMFSMYVDGGIEENPVAGFVSFIVVIALLSPFLYKENKKSFIEPLQRLEALINDMDSTPGD